MFQLSTKLPEQNAIVKLLHMKYSFVLVRGVFFAKNKSRYWLICKKNVD